MLAKRNGFTLVEIMIVVLIIGMLLTISLPNFLHARDTSRTKVCQNNLRQISAAKDQWAMENKAAPNDEPKSSDLVNAYLKGEAGGFPTCPSSGSYTIGSISTIPTCSIGANSTPDQNDDHVYPPLGS